MKLGICCHPGDLAVLPSMTFDFIESHVQNFLVPEKSEADFAPQAVAARVSLRPLMSVNCFLPGDLKVTGPSVNPLRLARYAETAFIRTQSIGLTMIVFGSGGARQVPEGWSQARGFEQYVEALRICGPLAQKHGVTLVVEPLNRGECNLINTVDEGAEAVRRAGQPHVRLLVDIFHMLRNDEAPDAIVHHAELITHSHIAEKAERTQPGARGDDFRPFLKALRQAHHCQSLALECKWEPDIQTALVPSLGALRWQLADMGF